MTIVVHLEVCSYYCCVSYFVASNEVWIALPHSFLTYSVAGVFFLLRLVEIAACHCYVVQSTEYGFMKILATYWTSVLWELVLCNESWCHRQGDRESHRALPRVAVK